MSGNTHSQPIPRQTGRVKWFNNKSGFGFITVCASSDSDANEKVTDVFVHYSSLNVSNSQYRYLVQGEYVDFELAKPEKGEHEFHAVNVTGVKGGELMCETLAVSAPVKTPNTFSDLTVPAAATRPKKEKPIVRVTKTEDEGFISVAHRGNRRAFKDASTTKPNKNHNKKE